MLCGGTSGCAAPPPPDEDSPLPRARAKAILSEPEIEPRWMAAALDADDPVLRLSAQRRLERDGIDLGYRFDMPQAARTDAAERYLKLLSISGGAQ